MPLVALTNIIRTMTSTALPTNNFHKGEAEGYNSGQMEALKRIGYLFLVYTLNHNSLIVYLTLSLQIKGVIN